MLGFLKQNTRRQRRVFRKLMTSLHYSATAFSGTSRKCQSCQHLYSSELPTPLRRVLCPFGSICALVGVCSGLCICRRVTRATPALPVGLQVCLWDSHRLLAAWSRPEEQFRASLEYAQESGHWAVGKETAGLERHGRAFGHMSQRHLRKFCSYAQLTCVTNV